ncbi:MAG: trypsin-like peptidase domain-containing protein [Clostridiales bacterium]|nr:trypsin-like peptidase domain-containing protein [Clostridiales bacterium]
MSYYDDFNYPPAPPARKKRGGAALAVAFLLVAVLAFGLVAGILVGRGLDQNAALPSPAPVLTDTTPEPAPDDRQPVILGNTPDETQFLPDGPFTRSQVVEIAAPSVVGIDVTVPMSGFGGRAYETEGSGSGVILSADGYIVTCLHVVDGASEITVTLNDDRPYPAALVGKDARNDIAIIKIEAEGLTPATTGNSDMLTVGEDVIAIGNPLGELRGTATSGIISAVNRPVRVESMEMTLLQTDAAISPGSSGGGLFNASGQLIGIVNAKATSNSAEGLGFAIPVNSVLKEINDLVRVGYITGRAYLGVYTQNVTMRGDGGDFFGQYFGTSCVQVADVVADSAAERAGILTGDLILKVGEVTITSNADLSSVISGYNAGDKTVITLQRNGQQVEVEVTFDEYKP